MNRIKKGDQVVVTAGKDKGKRGDVVRVEGDKTVIVSVERRVMHPIYKKYIRRSKRYAAHDPENRHKVGDVVRIAECRPLSKTKNWRVVKILTRAEA